MLTVRVVFSDRARATVAGARAFMRADEVIVQRDAAEVGTGDHLRDDRTHNPSIGSTVNECKQCEPLTKRKSEPPSYLEAATLDARVFEVVIEEDRLRPRCAAHRIVPDAPILQDRCQAGRQQPVGSVGRGGWARLGNSKRQWDSHVVPVQGLGRALARGLLRQHYH